MADEDLRRGIGRRASLIGMGCGGCSGMEEAWWAGIVRVRSASRSMAFLVGTAE